MEWKDFIKDRISIYERDHKDTLETILNYYDQLPISDAKQIAVYGYISDDLNVIRVETSHVAPIDKKILDKAQNRIASIKDETFLKQKNFKDLYQLVEDVIKEPGDIGPMVCYDTALRLGATLRILPDEVYIQRKAKLCAELLLPKNITKNRSIKQNLFPIEFRTLNEAYHIENFLCLNYDEINKFLKPEKNKN